MHKPEVPCSEARGAILRRPRVGDHNLRRHPHTCESHGRPIIKSVKSRATFLPRRSRQQFGGLPTGEPPHRFTLPISDIELGASSEQQLRPRRTDSSRFAGAIQHGQPELVVARGAFAGPTNVEHRSAGGV